MTKLRYDKSGLYPQNILDMFRYDNETIFSYKVNVKISVFSSTSGLIESSREDFKIYQGRFSPM